MMLLSPSRISGHLLRNRSAWSHYVVVRRMESSRSWWDDRATELVRKSKAFAASAGKAAASRSQQLASRTYDKTTNAIRGRAVAARQRVVDALTFRNTRQRIRASVASSQQQLSNSMGRLKGGLQESIRPAWNAFFWWSLAAIGVYGVASTVPRELVRGLFDHDAKEHNSTDKKNET